jgi:uncharacterized membrane protein
MDAPLLQSRHFIRDNYPVFHLTRQRYCGLILHVLWIAADQQAKLYSAFSAHRKHLERRIEMILKNDGSKKKNSVRMLAAAVTLALVFVGTTAAYAGNAAQLAEIAERKPNTVSGNEGGVVEWGPIPEVNGLGREDAEVEIAGNSGSVERIPLGSLRNGLGSDDTVTLQESSGDPRYWSALPENGLNNPDPAVEAANRTFPVPPSDMEPLTRGNLNPGKGYSFDRQTMGKGSQVTIYASWTSPDSDLLVGLLSLSTNTLYYDTLTGGEGSATLQVNTTDEYAIYVGNPSPSAVPFDVSYIVN